MLSKLPGRKAKTLLIRLLVAAIATSAGSLTAQAAPDFSKEMILNDPAAPVSGNPQGDVTIVAFFDYNCPFCKKGSADLERFVKDDGNVRLVYKDWPILSEASTYGARAALAAKYQGKYDVVHTALMTIPGRRISEEEMRKAIAATDVDMARLDADMASHAAAIETILDRNLAQADGLGLQGTPVYLIGSFMLPAALDYAAFQKLVAETRDAKAK